MKCYNCGSKKILPQFNEICAKCFIQKCPVEGCINTKCKCQKNTKCANIMPNCLEHCKITTCSKCVSGCLNCGTTLDLWDHQCGKFCTQCEPRIEIDVSPLTLIKLLPDDHPRKTSVCHLIYCVEYRCSRCMNGKTVKDIQSSIAMERYK